MPHVGRIPAVCLALMLLTGCYETPRPLCGFRCGAHAECPADYTCAADGQCHLQGTPPTLSCPLIDAAVDAEPALPSVTKIVPADKEMSVASTVTPLAVFNKDVIGVSSSTFTLTLRDGVTPVAAVVTYDPTTRTASLTPDLPLYTSKVYDVALSAEIADRHGHRLGESVQWSFLTEADTTPPTVTMTSPIAGAVDVGVDSVLVASFSEPVAQVSAMSFVLASTVGAVAGRLGYPSSTVLSFTPTVQLAPHTIYEATLSSIFDVGGNQLAPSSVTWTFTTGADTVAPVVVSSSPLEDDTDVSPSVAITVRFSEPVIGVSTASMSLQQGGSSVPASVTYAMATRIARLVPDAPLQANTTYVVQLTSEIQDASGNSISGAPVTWQFTTASP